MRKVLWEIENEEDVFPTFKNLSLLGEKICEHNYNLLSIYKHHKKARNKMLGKFKTERDDF